MQIDGSSSSSSSFLGFRCLRYSPSMWSVVAWCVPDVFMDFCCLSVQHWTGAYPKVVVLREVGLDSLCSGPTQRDGQQFKLTVTSATNLESSVNLTCKSLDCGRTPEYLEGIYEWTGRWRKLHTDTIQKWIRTRSFWLQGANANHRMVVCSLHIFLSSKNLQFPFLFSI